MVWIQGLASFAVWIAWGLWQRKRAEAWRDRIARLPRAAVVAVASVGFVLSATVLLGALMLVSSAQGIAGGTLKPWAWLVVTAVGLVFVGMQTASATALVLLVRGTETPRPARSSDRQEPSSP